MSIQNMADAAQRYSDAVSQATNGATPGVKRTSNVSGGSADHNEITQGAVIQLSPGAQFFARLLGMAAAVPEVRADAVAAAKAQVSQDLAPAATEQLAAKLLPSTGQ